jgi:hypothetical protein
LNTQEPAGPVLQAERVENALKNSDPIKFFVAAESESAKFPENGSVQFREEEGTPEFVQQLFKKTVGQSES